MGTALVNAPSPNNARRLLGKAKLLGMLLVHLCLPISGMTISRTSRRCGCRSQGTDQHRPPDRLIASSLLFIISYSDRQCVIKKAAQYVLSAQLSCAQASIMRLEMLPGRGEKSWLVQTSRLRKSPARQGRCSRHNQLQNRPSGCCWKGPSLTAMWIARICRQASSRTSRATACSGSPRLNITGNQAIYAGAKFVVSQQDFLVSMHGDYDCRTDARIIQLRRQDRFWPAPRSFLQRSALSTAIACMIAPVKQLPMQTRQRSASDGPVFRAGKNFRFRNPALSIDCITCFPFKINTASCRYWLA